jgi:TonB-linked SusC/RagA family outer membrane protein
MNMKRNILNFMQTGMLRAVVCTCVAGLPFVSAFAQSEDDEEEELGAVIKQPKRVQVEKTTYPMMTLKGMVTDLATGKPLTGIQLQSLGNNRYTAMTDENGAFQIKVPTFVTALYVHAPEFLAQQVAVKAGDSTQVICVKMLSDKFQSMYGTGTDYTAQRTAQINRFGVTVDNEITSKLGGDMRTIMRSAAVDGGASMFIRGLNSITSDAQPLVVVDGIEMDMQRNRTSLHDGQFNNVLANIAPDDIEKVTVLKNATALYGARGANGVVLIETKRGHSMATRIEANVAVGVQLIPRLPKLMDATQYRTYAAEMIGTISQVSLQNQDFAFLNDNPDNPYYYMYHNNTDWNKNVYRNALTQNYSINVQGGDDVGMYNLSVGYVKAQNTVKESVFDRMNVRFNTDINILWNLSTKFDISISRTNNSLFDDGMQSDFTTSTVTSPTALALIKSPLLSPYQYNSVVGRFTNLLSDYDNLLGRQNSGTTYYTGRYAQSLANPVALIENGTADNKNKSENTYFNVHVAPVLKISRAWKLSADVSYSLNRNAQRYYRPFTGIPWFTVDDLGSVSAMVASMFAKEQNFVAKLQGDWNQRYGQHEVGVFVGARYNYFGFDNSDLTTEYKSIVDDKNPVLSTSGFPGVEGVNDVWKQIQWYANANYNFANRYFATVSLLSEANSRFGKNASGLKLCGVRWAFFPSVQLGWVITNEMWFPKNAGFNYLKLNAGFDVSGNDNISNYAARTSYTAVKYYDTAMGIQLTNVGNDKIQWESTKKFDVGLQAYMLNNRLGVSFDYYYHKTDNLLMLKSFSNPIGGINRYWSNGGSLSNQGFELTLTGKPVVTKDWRMELGVSVGHYKNKVTKLPDGDYTTSVYGDNNILTSVGNPVALFYGYQTEGVFSTDAEAKAAGQNGYLYMENNAGNRYDFKAGDVHFVDQNGDGIINEADKTIIGDPNPDIYGNIFASLNWKDLTLSLGFNYSLGNDIYNYQRSILNAGSNFFNQQVAETGRWRYEGQQATLPRANFGDPMGNNRFSDRWIEDGSYLRLKSVNLSYRLPIPGSWTWLQGLTVWAEAQNLFTLTKYLGNDPELSIGSSVYYQGIDCGNLAAGRSFIAGIKINL